MVREFIISYLPMWIFSVLSETEAQQRLSISRQILFCNFQKTCRNLVRVRALFCCQVLLRLQEELLCLPALLSHTHSHMKNAPMALSIWRAFLKCLACHINGVHTRFNLIQLSFRTGWKKKKKPRSAFSTSVFLWTDSLFSMLVILTQSFSIFQILDLIITCSDS